MVTFQPSSFPVLVANRERVEQALRGMLVRAVARIEDRNRQSLRHEFRRARSRVTNDDPVRAHGFQSPHRVDQRFALLQAGRFRLQVHGVRAEPRRGGGEADPRAR